MRHRRWAPVPAIGMTRSRIWAAKADVPTRVNRPRTSRETYQNFIS